MSTRKTLQELTLKDDFMFGTVMAEEKNCRDFLELVLGFPIGRIEVIREKTMAYHPENRGVRLDVYAKDNEEKRYNVEMQLRTKPEIGKRVRYYHSQIDMEALLSGQEYEKLPDVYVIFICDFDPFGSGRYCYTFQPICEEDHQLVLNDGSTSIFLSTCGKNEEETPESLVQFLKYAGADLPASTEEYGDAFVRQLQESVRRIKGSRRMEEKFMRLEELLREERAEGKAEGREAGREEGHALGKEEGRVLGKAESVLELLEDCGTVPEELKERILTERDLDCLRRWHKLAARAASVEQFTKEMEPEAK